MADKVDKPKKKAKGKKDEKGVLSALPSTRPERIGGRRAAGSSPPVAETTNGSAEPANAAKSTTASAKRTSTAKSTTASAKTKTAAPRATAARRKAAAPRTFEPTEAAEAAAGAADERAAGAIPLSETQGERTGTGTYPRPRPVREGAPGIGTAGYRDHPDDESGRPTGVELATTAVRAAGEVAQLGLTIGGHVLKRVVERLPKP